MLGSSSEADDAVQESWFRLSRGDPSAINRSAWMVDDGRWTNLLGHAALASRDPRTERRQLAAEQVVQGDERSSRQQLAGTGCGVANPA